MATTRLTRAGLIRKPVGRQDRVKGVLIRSIPFRSEITTRQITGIAHSAPFNMSPLPWPNNGDGDHSILGHPTGSIQPSPKMLRWSPDNILLAKGSIGLYGRSRGLDSALGCG